MTASDGMPSEEEIARALKPFIARDLFDVKGRQAARAVLALLPQPAGRLQKRPVAFRYKNEADEWVLTADEAETQRALDTGHDAQGLYVRDGTLPQPAGRDEGLEEAAKWHDHWAANWDARVDGGAYARWHEASAAALRAHKMPTDATSPPTPGGRE